MQLLAVFLPVSPRLRIGLQANAIPGGQHNSYSLSRPYHCWGGCCLLYDSNNKRKAAAFYPKERLVRLNLLEEPWLNNHYIDRESHGLCL